MSLLSRKMVTAIREEKAAIMEQLDGEILRTEDRLTRLKEAKGKIAAQHTALVDAEKVSE